MKREICNVVTSTTHSQAKTEITAHVLTIENAAIAYGFRGVPLVFTSCTKCVLCTMVMFSNRIIIARFTTIVVIVQVDFVVYIALVKGGYFNIGIYGRNRFK